MTILQLQNVTKMYGGVVGVKDVNLAVERGSVFGFLGPNGAGKTTTINMLLDLLRPTSGQITIFNLDAQADSLAIRARVGFLAGDMAMDRGLSGWQELEFLGNLRGHFDRPYVQQLAERLDCNLERKFKNLSRGNKQKIGLIAALMHRPELLILDEPTSGLDPLIQAEFNKLILEHQRKGGTTFISSHMLSEVQELCDHLAFIRGGQLAAVMPMAQLAAGAPKLIKVTSDDRDLHRVLKRLHGLTIESQQADKLVGSYQGDIGRLLGLLATHRVSDVTIEDADLEAVFMKYYHEAPKKGRKS